MPVGNNRLLYLKLQKLPKREICLLALQTCKHGHSMLSHPQCCPELNVEDEVVGFLDIETSDLKANRGFMYCYVIKGSDGSYHEECLKPNEVLSKAKDRRLLSKVVRDLKRYDRIVTYYGSGFDLPFLRTRCVAAGVEFPMWNQLLTSDLYRVIRQKFNMSRRSLSVACETFGIGAKKSPHDFSIWERARDGDQTALKHILQHNREDVDSTEELYYRIYEYAGMRKTSI